MLILQVLLQPSHIGVDVSCFDLQASNEDPEDVFQPDEDMLEASVSMPRACNPGPAFPSALREWG